MQNREGKAYGIAIKSTPIINGNEDESWCLTPIYKTEIVLRGEKPTTANFKVLWDENKLYVLAEVNDSTPIIPDLENRYKESENDSIEIFIDLFNIKTDVYGQGCTQYRVNLNNQQSGSRATDLSLMESTVRLTEYGYVVVVALTFEANFYPRAGKSIGFDLCVNDNMGNGRREGISTWSDDIGEAWRYPYVFGTIILK
ncbi:MAG TPA: sugar-binding protein [Clostridiaceae bacterium]